MPAGPYQMAAFLRARELGVAFESAFKTSTPFLYSFETQTGVCGACKKPTGRAHGALVSGCNYPSAHESFWCGECGDSFLLCGFDGREQTPTCRGCLRPASADERERWRNDANDVIPSWGYDATDLVASWPILVTHVVTAQTWSEWIKSADDKDRRWAMARVDAGFDPQFCDVCPFSKGYEDATSDAFEPDWELSDGWDDDRLKEVFAEHYPLTVDVVQDFASAFVKHAGPAFALSEPSLTLDRSFSASAFALPRPSLALDKDRPDYVVGFVGICTGCGMVVMDSVETA